MKFVQIFFILFFQRSYAQISNCAINNYEKDTCIMCVKGFTRSKSQDSCSETIPNCLVYSSAQYNSCSQCQDGYSPQKIDNKSKIISCNPNFVDDIKQKCKPGFILTAQGFCIFSIYNCIKYSTTQFDENNNPLCDTCHDSNGSNKADSPYTADYILSENKKTCIPKILGCISQQDNQCLIAQPDRPIANSKRWCCTTCAPGTEFKIDKCQEIVKPPCDKKGFYLANIDGGICLEETLTAIDHCVEYGSDKKCKKCFKVMPSSCQKTNSIYNLQCREELQPLTQYILVGNSCQKEIVGCWKQNEAGKCQECAFGYNLINEEYNCQKDPTINLSKYSKKLKFLLERDYMYGGKNKNNAGIKKSLWPNQETCATKEQIELQLEDSIDQLKQTCLKNGPGGCQHKVPKGEKIRENYFQYGKLSDNTIGLFNPEHMDTLQYDINFDVENCNQQKYSQLWAINEDDNQYILIQDNSK